MRSGRSSRPRHPKKPILACLSLSAATTVSAPASKPSGARLKVVTVVRCSVLKPALSRSTSGSVQSVAIDSTALSKKKQQTKPDRTRLKWSPEKAAEQLDERVKIGRDLRLPLNPM